jgi:hypothetical protein
LLETVQLIVGPDSLSSFSSDRAPLTGAIEAKDTAFLFGWLMERLSLQGVSDAAALSFMEKHGRVSWLEVANALRSRPSCPKLSSYWSFQHCRYEKTKQCCGRPDHIDSCPLPRADLRRGGLNVIAFGLALFIRDVANGDLVGFIDARLGLLDNGRSHADVATGLIESFQGLIGVSNKVLSMAFADLLMAAPASKRHWIEIGANMIAVDTLVHNLLHRTGTLERFDAQHRYGPACYRPNGCAAIIRKVADEMSRRALHQSRTTPRGLQHQIWLFASQAGYGVCNGIRIDDRRRCTYKPCSLFCMCDQVRLR